MTGLYEKSEEIWSVSGLRWNEKRSELYGTDRTPHSGSSFLVDLLTYKTFTYLLGARNQESCESWQSRGLYDPSEAIGSATKAKDSNLCSFQ